MNRNNIQIREARLDSGQDELRQISRILIEGAELMGELGETHWEVDQFELTQLDSMVRARQLFVVTDGTTPLHMNDPVVGTFKIQTEDSLFWPEMNPDDAVYLHKIALTKAMRGQGLTREIIHWAKSYAVQRERKYLRLDTDRARPGLCRLYADLGFSFHSYKKLDWIEVVRFQMEACPLRPCRARHASVCDLGFDA